MTLLVFDSTTIDLLLLGTVLLISFASDLLTERFRFPDVLWLIALGFAAGPLFHLIPPGPILALAPLIGTAALVIILYDAGLDMNARLVRPFATSAILFAVVGWAIALGLLFGVSLLLFAPGQIDLSLIFAVAFACTSGAVIIPIATRLIEDPSLRAYVHLDGAIEDTLSIVGLSVLLTVLAATPGQVSTSVALSLLLPLPVAIGIGLAGAILARQFLARWQDRPFALIALLGILLVVYSVAEALGGAGVFAVLVLGIVIANEYWIRGVLARWRRRRLAQPFEVGSGFRRMQGEFSSLLRAVFLFMIGVIVPLQPLALGAIVAVIVLPVALYYLRRLLATAVAQRGTIHSAGADHLGALYGRGLTNAVLLVLPIAIFPGLQALLLPGFVLIVGTNILMTLRLLSLPGLPPTPELPDAQTPRLPLSVEAWVPSAPRARPPLPSGNVPIPQPPHDDGTERTVKNSVTTAIHRSGDS
ncbi:MAG: cation:proton antiporter domain-containing protein [Thermoplasmata archaeon]